MNQIDNEQFIRKSRQAFEVQTDSLDLKTQQHLTSARKKALSQSLDKTKKPSFTERLNLKWITGAGAGLALASVLTFMIAPSLFSTTNNQDAIAFLDDIELLSQETELDLYTQLDFYEWLDESLEAEL